jgi:PIN domain nuclease of toxin-antitoxin system
LLWTLGEVRELSDRARDAISQQAERVFVSAVSVWEVAIKRSLGRLEAPAELLDLIERSGFEELPVTFVHGLAVAELPLHHRDPFDRLLVAQAREEGLTIATADAEIGSYDVAVLDVIR